jgi:hypothetical protein
VVVSAEPVVAAVDVSETVATAVSTTAFISGLAFARVTVTIVSAISGRGVVSTVVCVLIRSIGVAVVVVSSYLTTTWSVIDVVVSDPSVVVSAAVVFVSAVLANVPFPLCVVSAEKAVVSETCTATVAAASSVIATEVVAPTASVVVVTNGEIVATVV